MDLEALVYEKRGHVVTITLNRPHAMNAYDSVMCGELTRVWEEVQRDDDVRVAILTGAGDRAFCSGIDVKEMASGGQVFSVSRGEVRLTARQCKVWKPVIAAVNGFCIGGGLHFVTDADMTICSENSTFFDTHLRIGQVMAVEAIGLSRKIPLGEVLRMVLTSGRGGGPHGCPAGLRGRAGQPGGPPGPAHGRGERYRRRRGACAPVAVRGSLEAI